jgi:amino acid adenylation domain-containing protein
VSEQQWRTATVEARDARRKPQIVDIYPLAPLQSGMLFLSLLNPRSPLYLEQLAYELTGPLDPQTFEAAWRAVVQRHDALRTSFVWADLEEPLQVVQDEVTLPFRHLDWTGERSVDERSRLLDYMRTDRQQTFTLTHAPLLRAALIAVDRDTWFFVWSYHHLVLDGWSAGVVWRDVFAYYNALVGVAAEPTPPMQQYRAHIAWLQNQDIAAAERVWTDALRGFRTPTLVGELTNVTEGRTAAHIAKLDVATTEALRVVARRSRVTLNTVVQSACGLLLGRMTGESDICFGAILSGRSPEIPHVEQIVGMFINTLPVRMQIRSRESFAEHVRAVQAHQVAAREYDYASLVDVHGWSDVPRDLPLFDTILLFQNYPRVFDGTQLPPGLSLQLREAHGATGYPMTVFAGAEDFLGFRFLYDEEAFDRPRVERLAHRLKQLLRSVAERPDARLSELEWFGEEERRLVLVEWNRTQTEYERGLTLAQLVERQVVRSPEATALVFRGEELSYGELNRRANRLAWRLRELGVGAEVPVGICLARGFDMVVSVLAVLKAGGAYVPLDPDYPEERLRFMVGDTEAPIVIVSEPLAARCSDAGAELLVLDRERRRLSAYAAEDPPPVAGPENLAYIVYTSGSTGQPKGILVEHRGATNFVEWLGREFPLEPMDRVLQITSLGFDVSMYELLWPLGAGATVVLADDHWDPSLAHVVAANAVTNLHLVPTVLDAFVDALAETDCPTLRRVFCSSEAMPPHLEELFFARSTAELFYFYGVTEVSVESSVWRCDRERRRIPIPVGRPIANTEIYVLDAEMRPQAVETEGEIYIGGESVTRGYLHRPALTAERFVPDPFGGRPGARLYRTGDRGKWTPDGYLTILGRVDEQIKIRGLRVEPAEVEVSLRVHSAVADAVVIGRECDGSGAKLVAYCVAEAGAAPASVELREFLRQRLPEYMIPSAFVTLDRLPVNPNGKVDRKALPPPPAFGDVATGRVPPRTALEGLVAEIWAQVLGLERVGVHDNFFDLGGHSLLATQVVSRIAAALGVDLPLRTLFEAPTIAEQSVAVRALEHESVAVEAPQRLESRTEVPLGLAQQRLWFLDQFEPGSGEYVLPLVLRRQGGVDARVLERVFEELIVRHESLRTRFVSRIGVPVQVIDPPRPLEVGVVDLSDLDEPVRSESVEKLVREGAERPFDLSAGPLLRATLIRLAPQDDALVLWIHHIVSDGWSLEVLARELGLVYDAFAVGAASPLAELPIQYADFAVWQREWLQEEALERQLAFWREQLAGVVPLELPPDHPRPARRSWRAGVCRFSVPPEFVERLRDVSRHERATTFMVLLAAFQLLLSRHSGQVDVAVGTPVANRMRVELEELIGCFVNTLVLRTDLSGDPSFRELLQRVRATALAAYPHQDLPFERLVEELQLERDLSRQPLVQAEFALQHDRDDRQLFGDVVPVNVETAKFDLSLLIQVGGGGLTGKFVYNSDLFEPPTIERLAQRFVVLLRSVAERPDARLSELEWFGEEERRLVLVEWNRTQTEYERGLTLAQLVERQVVRSPEATALVFRGEELSYGELNRRANRLAWRLRELGVGAEVPVGICLARGFDMVVSVLAVLKAGGAYVPLDPDYPEERLRFMVGDTEAPIVIVSEPLAARCSDAGAELLVLDRERRRLSAYAAEDPPPVAGPENLAYIVYTSGSTGQPKGVMIDHRSLTNFMQHMPGVTGLATDDRLLAVTTLTFDIAALELFLPLCVGARVAISEHHNDGEELAKELVAHDINVMQATPSTWQMLLDSGWSRGGICALVGGEQLPRRVAERLLTIGCRVVNLYGPSETTIWSTSSEISALDDQPIAIGRPIANTQVYVADRHLRPVPAGVRGELCIGGEGVARGYVKRPAMTAERFVPDPFGGRRGACLYRTGDWAHWSSSGALTVHGRLDDQVKVRGMRIEPGEVEARVRAHPEVAQAVVVARENRPGDRRLVAYVVGVSGSRPDIRALREFVREHLPPYMVPDAFVVIDRLPLNRNRKVDRNALPPPDGAGDDRFHVPPQTPTERAVADVWREFVGIDRVGVLDNFFELGGHSLLATQVVARTRELLGTDIPLRALFEAGTLGAFAAAVEAEMARTTVHSGVSAAGRVVRISTGRGARPIIAVHDGSGDVSSYVTLAKHLGGEHTVLGFRARSNATEVDVADLAAEYVEELLAAPFDAPALLVGWSFGALVAFEMALQLRARGMSSQPVALLDPPLAARDAPGAAAGGELARAVAYLRTAAATGRWDAQALRDELQSLARAQFTREACAAGPEALLPIVETMRRHEEAWLRYEPSGVFEGRAALVLADQEAEARLTETSWRRWLVDPDVHVLCATHLGLVGDPTAELVARALSDLMRASEKSCRHPVQRSAADA